METDNFMQMDSLHHINVSNVVGITVAKENSDRCPRRRNHRGPSDYQQLSESFQIFGELF